ncbi:MAG: glycosyltransferase [Pseudonocardiales bacterium]|nr:glycosyltransferase [Pseudonocardiales bacterium]
MFGSLLYLLNVSNPDRLSADSGWIFANVLLPALADQGAEISIACPAVLPDPRIRSLPTAVPGTKYRARFGLDMDEAAHLVQASRPAVVFTNQMENAPALRAVMLETGSAGMLAGYCHYVPFHLDTAGKIVHDPSLDDGDLGMSVILQFFSGVLACDRALVHSQTSHDWITGAAAQLNLELGDRLRIVMPARDPRVVRRGETRPPGGDPVAVYNHRLYAHYGTSRFVDLARRLTVATSARVRVLDVFGTRRAGRTRLDPSPERYRRVLSELDGVEVLSDGGDRRTYREVLAGAHVAFAPFRPGCSWSMSVIDCQAMGVPVIAPRMGWLAEAVDEQLLFDHEDQAVELAQRLISDPVFWIRHSAAARRFTEVLTPASAAARFVEALA